MEKSGRGVAIPNHPKLHHSHSILQIYEWNVSRGPKLQGALAFQMCLSPEPRSKYYPGALSWGVHVGDTVSVPGLLD